MVKELNFDLHFTRTVIEPLTKAGQEFCHRQHSDSATPEMYRLAVGSGLHVRFEDAHVRDWVTLLKST